jgi:hypothetical protein
MLFSCNSVLDKQPLNIITDNNVWNSQTLIDAYLTEVYAETYVFTNECGQSGASTVSGDQWTEWSDINGIADEDMNEWATSVEGYKDGGLKISGGLLEWWENAYTVIRECNEFIQKVKTAPVDTAYKKERAAEARFIRAFNYFSMVKRYGGVPLITVPQSITDSQKDLFPARATEQQIYDFVIHEMDTIANELPETNDAGRACKYAALALESRAALYAGSIAEFGSIQLNGTLGIPANLANIYYQKSYTASRIIITSAKYALYNANPDKVMNFRDVFLIKNNCEDIFVKQHTYTDAGAGGNGWSYDFFQCPWPDAWGGGNQDAPYLEMAEEFEHTDGSSGKLDRNAIQQGLWTTDALWANKDPRFFATLYTQNTEWQGNLLDWHNGLREPDGTIITSGSYNGVLAVGTQRTWGGTGFGVLKYLDESHSNMGNRATSGTDYIVFRYAEILLNYAEAAYELGDSGDALWAINVIRNRAGIAPLVTVDRDQIRHERKVELAFEGHRYWDVRRWRIATTTLSINNSGIRYILDYQTNKYELQVINDVDGTVAGPEFYPYNYYLPITVARTGQNPNLVENPGY